MRLTIRKEAEQDIKSAISWYNQQQHDVGNQLLTELFRVFEHVSDNPQLFPEILPGIRRALTRRFPYAVYYRVSSEEITVYAVLHQRRAPTPWPQL